MILYRDSKTIPVARFMRLSEVFYDAGWPFIIEHPVDQSLFAEIEAAHGDFDAVRVRKLTKNDIEKHLSVIAFTDGTLHYTRNAVASYLPFGWRITPRDLENMIRGDRNRLLNQNTGIVFPQPESMRVYKSRIISGALRGEFVQKPMEW
jgi:hypothetical protein